MVVTVRVYICVVSVNLFYAFMLFIYFKVYKGKDSFLPSNEVELVYINFQ